MPILRKLLAWMLLLALPVQALAAGGLATCHAAAGPAGAMVASALPDGAAAPPPCHESPAQPESAACSACALCCVVAMPTVAVLPSQPVGPIAAPPVATLPAPASAWALPLERPPRRLQA